MRGLVLIALAAFSWGTTGSVTTVLVERADATPLVIGATRMAFRRGGAGPGCYLGLVTAAVA